MESLFILPPSPYCHQPTPVQRVRESGVGSLSDLELIAIVTGSIDSAGELLDRAGSLRRAFAPGGDAGTVPGIGPAASARVDAVSEIARRIARENATETGITSPEEAYELLAPEMRDLAQESVRVILLNHRKKIIKVEEIFRGTGNESFANPKEIIRAAITHSAAALILAHNHPSGDPSPSCADHNVTKRMKGACDAVGIEFTDHVIIGRPAEGRYEAYFSFREAGLI